MDRPVTPPKRVTSPTWGPPPPCKQALPFMIANTVIENTVAIANSIRILYAVLFCTVTNDKNMDI